MKIFTRPLSMIAAVATALASTATSQAQLNYFRTLGATRTSDGVSSFTANDSNFQTNSPRGLAPLVETDEETGTHNILIGENLSLSFALGMGVEYNDNITLSENNQLSDIILRPGITMDAAWRLSELNTLRLSIGASYEKYLDHDEFDSDGLVLAPNTALRFGFQVGDVRFTVFDAISYQEDTFTSIQLFNTGRFRRWENTVGINMDWQLTESINLGAGYTHYNLWPKGDGFEQEKRAIDTFTLRPSVQITPSVRAGVNASYSIINYSSDERADADTILVGPFIEWAVTELTNVYLEGGYQRTDSDGTSTFDQAFLDGETGATRALFQDSSDSSSWYVKFEINQRLTETFQHRLSYTKTEELGFVTNTVELHRVEYSASWLAHEKLQIGPNLFWEHSDSSGEFGESSDRIGIGIGIRYFFAQNLTLGLDYRYLTKDSNVQDASYDQNVIFLSLYYKF